MAVRRRAQRVLVLFILLCGVVTLSACGARIDTVMHVNADGSGQRVITLTLPASDVQNLKGGAAAVDASVRTHLPPQMTFSGITTGADGALTATLTVSFTSPDDYVAKASSLLSTRSTAVTPPKFAVSDSELVRGVSIDESFASSDLIGWLFDGLQKDGVVSISSGSMWELGSTTLDFAGQQSSLSGAQVTAHIIDDQGFAKVSVDTEVKRADLVVRAITFQMPAGADPAKYASYLNSHSPKGAKLRGAGPQWTLTLSGTPDEVAAGTDAALEAKGSVLATSIAPVADDPASLRLTIQDRSNCVNICSLSAPPLTDHVSVALASRQQQLDIDMGSIAPKTVDYIPEFRNVGQTIAIDMFGGVTSTTRFAVRTTDAKLVHDGFARLLAPKASGAKLDKSVAGDTTTFTVTIHADNAAKFAEAYARWAPGGTFVATERSNWFSASTQYSFAPSLRGITGKHKLVASSPTRIDLPFGMNATGGSPVGTKYDRPVTVSADGLRPGGMAAIAGAVVLVGAAIVLIVRNRSKIRGRLTAAHVTELDLANFTRPNPYKGSLAQLMHARSTALPSRTLTKVGSTAPAIHRAPLTELSVAPLAAPTTALTNLTTLTTIGRRPSLLADRARRD
jgi:hypothetical protein